MEHPVETLNIIKNEKKMRALLCLLEFEKDVINDFMKHYPNGFK